MRIAGFGTCRTRSRVARTGRNPRTGEAVAIPASKAPAFRAARALKDRVKRGPEPERGNREDDGDMPGSGPGTSGQALDVSAWPGGLDPVRKLLAPESILALGSEPSAENSALRLAADLTEAELAGSAFVRNALILLEQIGGGETVWATNDGRLNKESVARMRELMSWPGMEATELYRTGKTYYEQLVGELHLLRSVARMAGADRGEGILVRADAAGARDAGARKPGRTPGAAVSPGVLAQRPVATCERPSPEAAGLVAAGRHRRGSLVDFRGGGGLAECGDPDGVVHGPGRYDAGGGAMESCVHDAGCGTSSIRCAGSGWWSIGGRRFRSMSGGARPPSSTGSCRSTSGSRTAARGGTSRHDEMAPSGDERGRGGLALRRRRVEALACQRLACHTSVGERAGSPCAVGPIRRQ